MLFVAAINCTRSPYDHMVAEILIISTNKGGRSMKFLMSDFALLVCVSFGMSEGEDSFFRFCQLEKFRSTEINKKLESKWIDNTESPRPIKPFILYTGLASDSPSLTCYAKLCDKNGYFLVLYVIYICIFLTLYEYVYLV